MPETTPPAISSLRAAIEDPASFEHLPPVARLALGILRAEFHPAPAGSALAHGDRIRRAYLLLAEARIHRLAGGPRPSAAREEAREAVRSMDRFLQGAPRQVEEDEDAQCANCPHSVIGHIDHGRCDSLVTTDGATRTCSCLAFVPLDDQPTPTPAGGT